MVSSPFRFSVTAGGISDADTAIELARRAEDLGYDTLSMPDHLDGQLATLPILAAAAMATTKLRLLTLVLGNDFRHPAFVAQEAATLDLISHGRLELGIGAGWMLSDYEGAGLPYDRPGIRIARLAESVAILKGLFADGPFSFTGEHYRIDGLDGHPKPAQRPHPPLMIAGGGPKVLSLAAREADIVGINPGLGAGVIDSRAGATATPDATDQKVEWIRTAAGDRFASIELQTRVHVAAITDDAQAMANAVAPSLGMTPDEALRSPHALVGTVDECIDTISTWRDRWGISYIGFSADAVDTMAPVVAALAGR